MRKFILCTLLALPLAQPSLAADEHSDSAVGGAKKAMARAMLDNESFVEKATIANMAEVELSRLALDRSKDSEIQQFARQMIKDHTAALEQLRPLAQARKISVPTALDETHKDKATKLATLQGAEFDREYSELMRKDHDKTVTLFSAAVEDKSLDAEFKQLASKLLPTLQQHQHAAHGLKSGQQATDADRKARQAESNAEMPVTKERP